MMTPALTLLIVLGLFAVALRSLKHPLYVAHMVWAAAVAYLATRAGWIADSAGAELIAPLLLIHVIIINIITFMGYGFDKYAAISGGWRIPEKTLYSFILLGGNLGAFLGSRAFRHKTKKTSFRQMALVVNLIQIVILVGLFFVL